MYTLLVLFVQMRVRARDRGTPSLSSSEATATVIVQRNLNAPRFLNPSNYVTLINETVPVGTVVLVVSAQDGDTVVSLSLLS